MFYLCAVNNTIISMRNWKENGLVCMWISLLVGLLSCVERPALDFDSIERIMPLQPDSALLRLDTAHVDPLRLSDTDRAHYYLLLTEALDKCYQTLHSDSLISTAIHYYKGKHDPNRLAKAWYYKGRILQDQNMPLQAQDAYLEATNVEGVTDHALLGRLTNSLGMLYTWQMVYEKANAYQRAAISHLTACNDSLGVMFAYRDLGRNYTQMDSLSQATACYQTAISYQTDQKIVSIYSELAALHLKTGNMAEAQHCLQQAKEQNEGRKRSNALLLVYGEYYLKTAQLDSAQHYLSLCRQSPRTRAAATLALAQIADQAGNYSASVDYYKQYNALRDSIIQQKQSQLLRNSAAYQEQQAFKDRLHRMEISLRDHKVYVLLLLSTALATLAAYLLTRLKLRRRDIEIKEQQVRLSELESNHERLRKRYAANQSQIEQIQSQSSADKAKMQWLKERITQLEEENRLIDRNLEQNAQLEQELFCSAVYKHFSDRKVEPSSLNEAEWRELIARLDLCYDNFTSRLRKLCLMSDKEVAICCLVKIKVAPSRMAELLCCSTSSITMTRARLYHKVMKQKGSPEQFDQFIHRF